MDPTRNNTNLPPVDELARAWTLYLKALQREKERKKER